MTSICMCALSPIVACRYALIETRWCCDTVQKYQMVVAFSLIADCSLQFADWRLGVWVRRCGGARCHCVVVARSATIFGASNAHCMRASPRRHQRAGQHQRRARRAWIVAANQSGSNPSRTPATLRRLPISTGCTSCNSIMRSCSRGNGEAARTCATLSSSRLSLSRYKRDNASHTRRCAAVAVRGVASDMSVHRCDWIRARARCNAGALHGTHIGTKDQHMVVAFHAHASCNQCTR